MNEAVQRSTMAQWVFGLFAPFLARLGAFKGDTRAQSEPIKEIAVGFILIAIALVIALTILPIVTSAVATAVADPNVSATDGVLLALLPTLLIVGLLAGGVTFLFQGFKKIRT